MAVNEEQIIESIDQEVIFNDFRVGWDVRQHPPTTIRRRSHEGRLPHIMGCSVQKDGALAWNRNIFSIDPPDGVTPRAMFEYVGKPADTAYNKLLVWGSDGKLQALATDWAAETPSIWDAGYELFNGGTWVEEKTGLQTSGPWGIVQRRNHVFFGHKLENLQYYNGETVGEVGIHAPLFATSTQQNLTAGVWTERDAGGYLTPVGAKVTALNLPQNVLSIMEGDFTVDYFDYGWSLTFEFQVSGASAADVYLVLAGFSNDSNTKPSAWTNEYVWFGVKYDGANYYLAANCSSQSEVLSGTTLTAGTTYYAWITRVGNTVSMGVWSGSLGGTFVAQVATHEPEEFRYLYVCGSPGGGDGGENVDGYVDDVRIKGISTGAGGNLKQGAYRYFVTYGVNDAAGYELFESMPSKAIRQTAADDDEMSLTGLPIDATGTADWRKIWRAFDSSGVGDNWTDYFLVAKIADNTTTTWVDTAPQDELSEVAPIYDRARPPRGDILTAHKHHVFMSGISQSSNSYDEVTTTGLGNRLYYTRYDQPWYWPGDYYIDVGDDADIVAHVSFGDHLIIFKTNSIWVLSGDNMDDHVLRQIDNNFGATDPCSVSSSPYGVVWTSPQGLVFWDGANTRLIYETVPVNPFSMPTTDFPWLCWHQDWLYFWVNTEVIRWNVLRDIWEMYPIEVNTAGLRSFNYGVAQSHVLCYADWTGSGADKITVLSPVKFFPNYAAYGNVTAGPAEDVKITFPPITAPPGYLVWIKEIWIDCDHYGFEGMVGAGVYSALTALHLYVNEDADYSSGDLGVLPNSARLVGAGNRQYTVQGYKLPPSYKAQQMFIQIAGDYSKDFVLRAVRVVFSLRKQRSDHV